jgi:hypothetical protein
MRGLGEMTASEAITFCRRHLTDSFNLIHFVDRHGKGQMVPSYKNHNLDAAREAAAAYNKLADLHPLIIRLENEGILK